MVRNLFLHLLLCVGFSLFGAPCAGQQPAEPDSNDIYQSRFLAARQAAGPDTNDVYESTTNYLLNLPRLAWTVLVYPVGRFTIHAEYIKLPTQALDLFMNADRTFGVLPQARLGGETGTGVGARVFHSNIAGKGKRFEGLYIYSGGRGQMAEALYMDPNLMGSSLCWRTEAAYLQTYNRGASINAAVRSDSTRLFQIGQGDVATVLGWRLRTGELAPYQRNVYAEGWFGYGRRDFRRRFGPTGPLTDPGSTPQARLLVGLGKVISFYRFGGRIAYDDRDYRAPARELLLPMNYPIPGRVLTYADGLYHFYRDLSYPERGGLFEIETEYVAGSDSVRFFRVAAEVQRFVTLFWRNRILAFRARLDRVCPVGSGTVPYPELARLGGDDRLRGYHRAFFRGQGALLLNLEYRYPIWDTWNAFLFYEEGQIFDHFNQIDFDGFRTSWGGGICARTETALLGRAQIAHSASEKVLIGFSLELAF